MERREYEATLEMEEAYWWFVGQRALLNKFLTSENWRSTSKKLKLLEIGSGTGRNLEDLSKYGDAMGIDISSDAREFSLARGLHVTSDSVEKINQKDETFDIVCSLGVFYHREVHDDNQALLEINRVLRPGGALFFFDSAMPCLYGNHDIAYHGTRRYVRRELKEKLGKAGFATEEIRYVNSMMFPLVYIKRKLDLVFRRPVKTDIKQLGPRLNSLLTSLFLLETRAPLGLVPPFGVNIMAIARKPG